MKCYWCLVEYQLEQDPNKLPIADAQYIVAGKSCCMAHTNIQRGHPDNYRVPPLEDDELKIGDWVEFRAPDTADAIPGSGSHVSFRGMRIKVDGVRGRMVKGQVIGRMESSPQG